MPLHHLPVAWQEEAAAVDTAFQRSGVKRTWPDDEPDQIIPMVNAMADEIIRLKKRFALSGNAENVNWEDMAETGRAYADNLIGEPNISELMHRMADEIELLRGYRDAAEADAVVARLLVDKLRLTDEEREAVEYFASFQWTMVKPHAAALRGLLERTKSNK